MIEKFQIFEGFVRIVLIYCFRSWPPWEIWFYTLSSLILSLPSNNWVEERIHSKGKEDTVKGRKLKEKWTDGKEKAWKGEVERIGMDKDEDEKKRKYWWGRGCCKEKALPATAENFNFKISDVNFHLVISNFLIFTINISYLVSWHIWQQCHNVTDTYA